MINPNPAIDRYVLAHMVEPIRVGKIFSKWPLHITVLPWFTYRSDLEALHRHVRAALDEQRPIKTTVGKKVFFNRTTPVHEVSPIDSLQAEHERLVELVQKNGDFSVHTGYTGKAYRPHITVRGERSIEPGRVLKLDDLYIVGAEPQGNARTVLARIAFGGAV